MFVDCSVYKSKETSPGGAEVDPLMDVKGGGGSQGLGAGSPEGVGYKGVMGRFDPPGPPIYDPFDHRNIYFILMTKTCW